METVREFVYVIARIDSGIYDVNRLDELFREPGKFVQLEMEWIQALLYLLQRIEQYVHLVERWVNHVTGLMRNLGATEKEIIQIQRQEIDSIDFFQKKSYNLNYLHWVLTDVSEEIDRLIADSQALMKEGPRMLELTKRFGGFFLEQVGRIAQVWALGDRRDFYTPLVHILQLAHTRTNPTEILQHLGTYISTIGDVVTSTPMFIDKDEVTSYSIESLQSSSGIVQQLMPGVENLSTFVGFRTHAYMLVLKHEEALMRAILPPTVSVSQWIAKHAVERSQPTDKLLPKTIDTGTLFLALQLAHEALIEWDAIIEKAKPHLEKALVLNELLQSPAVAKILKADQQRLELYHQWRPRIRNTFSALQRCIKS